ncbi:MAG: hypothetical protein WC052_00510 [Patescibacteria group bacterium]
MPITKKNETIEVVAKALPNPAYLESVTKYFHEQVFVEDNAREADRFYRVLVELLPKDSFKERYPELYTGYEKLLYECQFYAFAWLTEDEALNLVRNHFSLAFQLSAILELRRKIRVKLIADYQIEARDAFKEKLRRAAEQNTEVITGKQLQQDGAATTAPPTVGNWIRNYVGAVGTAGPVDALRQAEYFTKNKNFDALTQTEKEGIRWLLEIYESLRWSSLTPEGLEEVLSTNIDGKEVLISGGEVEEISPEIRKLVQKFQEVGLISESEKPSPAVLEAAVAASTVIAEKPVAMPPLVLPVAPALVTGELPRISALPAPPVVLPLPPVAPIIIPKPPAAEPRVEKIINPTPQKVVVTKTSESPSMVDVKRFGGAVGPIDELRLSTLNDFRKLDPDPAEAAKRILQKIHLLEDESYDRKADAIRAWRQSPVHRLYLDVIDESVRTGMPVTELFEKYNVRQTEWEALGTLSRDLSS